MTEQITPLKTQKVLDLCSGIGGFTLGHLISGGMTTVAFCEINSYCQQVLNLRFPQIPIISDIHDITTESLLRVGVKQAQDGIHPGVSTHKSGQTLHLSAAVMLVTPQQADCSDNIQGNPNKSPHLNTQRSPLGVPQVSLNVHGVEAMMGFPLFWTDVSLPTQELLLGLPLPQSPASVGSVVEKLQRLRQIAALNIANSGQNIKPLEDNTSSS